MTYSATIIYLSYAICRRDWSLYSFDEPIVMWDEPKEDRKWIYKNSNSRQRFRYYFGKEALEAMENMVRA